MSSQSKPINGLLGTKVRHNFSRNYIGTIIKIREDVRGYNYYVQWETDPEQSDWYSLTSLEKYKES